MGKNTPSPKISVILPAYNEERYLEESVESILNQTFKDFELIIINDCSADNTLKLIKNLQKKDKRIILLDNKKNLGSSDSINKGLKKAKGKYVALFCADDISHPKRLEIQFNYLEKNPQIFLIGSSAIYIDGNGKEIRRFRKYNHPKMLAWRLRKSCGIIFPSIMFCNEEISFDKDFVPADDYNLYHELLKGGKNLTNLPYFLVKYRVHPGGMSDYRNEEQKKAVKEILGKFKRLKDPTNLFERGYYSIKLFIHYLKTRNEKRIKK